MPVGYEKTWVLPFNQTTSVTAPGVAVEIAGAAGKRIKIRKVFIQDGTGGAEIFVRKNSTLATGGTPSTVTPKAVHPTSGYTPACTAKTFTGTAPTQGTQVADLDNHTTGAAGRDILFGEGGGLLAPPVLEAATDTLTIFRQSGAAAAFRGVVYGTEEDM